MRPPRPDNPGTHTFACCLSPSLGISLAQRLPMTPSAEASPPRQWRSSDVLRAVALALLLWTSLQFLWVARSVIIALLIGVIVGIAMVPAVDWLERHRVKRWLGSALVMLFVVGLITGLIALAAPTFLKQGDELRRKLPEAVDAIEKRLGLGTEIKDLLPDQAKPASTSTAKGPSQPGQDPSKEEQKETSTEEKKKPGLRGRLGEQLSGIAGRLFPVVSGIFAMVGAIFLIIFIAIFIASDPELYQGGLVHLIPKKSRPRSREVFREINNALRNWLVARLLAMIAVGLVTFGALLLLRVKAAAVLAMITALLEFIPFFGPIVSSVPAMGMALIDSPGKALGVAGAFFFIQQLEGNIITPLLLKKRVDVPPALTIGTVALMGVIFGVPGMLIAEPLLAASLVAVKMLYVEDQIGDSVEKSSS